MLLLKKIFLAIVAAVLIFIGGSGTQSSNILMQGGGLVGIVVGLVVLYIFGKLVWRAMGCLPSFLILIGISVFLLYAIGAFNDGVQNVIPNIKSFIGIGRTDNSNDLSDEETFDFEKDEQQSQITINENFNDNISEQSAPQTSDLQPTPPPSSKEVQKEESGGIMGFVSNLFGSKDSTLDNNFNPNDYPAVYGSVRVVSGDTFIMRRHYIRLFGIDAPEPNQTCSTSKGRPYYCGKEATRWLQEWLQENEIECHVLKSNSKGNVVATCSLGQYDIGAALVSAGWAISLPNNTVYGPYERQAQRARRGMWQGQFYKPWDWVKMQSTKPKVKIIKRKKRTKRLWDYL